VVRDVERPRLVCGGTLVQFSVREGSPSPDVRTIFEDSKHVLWIATSGGLAFSRMRQELAIDEKIGYRVIANNAASRPLRPIIRDEVYRIGREALVNAFLRLNSSCWMPGGEDPRRPGGYRLPLP
jgi:hypothetical protein